jgi:hypothetical protein
MPVLDWKPLWFIRTRLTDPVAYCKDMIATRICKFNPVYTDDVEGFESLELCKTDKRNWRN